jgi:hypothetical protein
MVSEQPPFRGPARMLRRFLQPIVARVSRIVKYTRGPELSVQLRSQRLPKRAALEEK